MSQFKYNLEVYELRPVTREVFAESAEEAIQKTKDFYSSGRASIHGEPKVMEAFTTQWFATVSAGDYDGWYDDETQYKTTLKKDLGPFGSLDEAKAAALGVAGSWNVELQPGWSSNQWRWFEETSDRGYRSVEVSVRSHERIELPEPAAAGVIEPEFV